MSTGTVTSADRSWKVDLTDDEDLIFQATARFIDDRCPVSTVRAIVDGRASVPAGYWSTGAELGWLSPVLPIDLGGTPEGRMAHAALVAETRGRRLQPGPLVPACAALLALGASGPDGGTHPLLPEMASGGGLLGWAWQAPGPGCRPAEGVQLTGRDGVYLLSGAMHAVQEADWATWFLVPVADDRGVNHVLVEARSPGVTLTRLGSIDLTRTFFEVRFEGVAVPADAVVMSGREGRDLLERQLLLARLLTAAESVGAMDELFGITVQYTKDRIAFGRPVGSFQAIKHRLADLSLGLEMCKAGLSDLTARLDGGEPVSPGLVCLVKAYVADLGVRLSQECAQIHGGIAFTWDYDLHLYSRRLVTDASLYGSSLHQRSEAWAWWARQDEVAPV